MIMNENNKQITDLLAFLEQTGISGQELALAEKYLKGETGDEVLDQFGRRDFSTAANNAGEVRRFMKGLDRSDKREACIRLFNILFAVGHDTCSFMFEYGSVYDLEECALYKRVVVFISHWTRNAGFLICQHWNRLLEMAHNNLETLKGLVEPLKKEGEPYAITVLTLYFNMKCQESGEIAAGDTPLMKAYEDMLLQSFDTWLAQQHCGIRTEVVDAIRSGQLTRTVLDKIKAVSMTTEARRRFLFIGSTAYLNFRISSILMDIVRGCMRVDLYTTLDSFKSVYIGGKGDTGFNGADYDETFDIEPEKYIRWAAMTGSRDVLKRQLEKNQESYIKALNSPLDAANVLKDVMKQENPTLYQQVIGQKKQNHERMIQALVENAPHAELAKEYLRGDCDVSELYPYDAELGAGFYGYGVQRDLGKYQRHCNDEAFIRRCRVFLVLRHSQYMEIEAHTSNVDGVKKFFANLDVEHLDIAHQLSGFCTLYRTNDYYSGCTMQALIDGAAEVFAGYLTGKREETLEAFSKAPAEGRFLALRVLRKDAEQNRQEILGYASDSAKLVREELLDILYAQKGWEDDIRELLDTKKAAQRELAAHVLSHWQQEGGNYNEVLLQAMKKEKNAKVLTLLQGALNIQESDSPAERLSTQDLIRQLHKGNRKRSLEWAYETPFPAVHRTDGEPADEEYLQAVLLCYASQDKCGINKNAQILSEELVAGELAVYMNELFDRWLAAGAESKKRWVLYAASIHGGEDIIQKLHHQIQEWPQMARGAIASEAVKALALNPSPRALLLVDGIARKFKFKQVRAAAGEALEFAAAELGISREELSDRIVPDLGFDETMQRTFDYGARIFKVMITPALDIEVYDENGKKLKNLPAPGKKDDETRAAAAYEDFKQMKKQMKAAVSSQKMRLEYALSAKREWSVDAWKQLFVRNPLMHQFAIGLIWGVYEDNKLIRSFRYMEDGSFNTQDEEEYELPEQARIGLVHPIELSDESKAAWKEQLEDYEITQPIEQIDRDVYYMTEEEAGQKSMERFGGCIVNGLALNGKLTGLGWYRGSVQDAGSFHTYYREDAELGMGVELHFSGSFIGWYDEEEVTVYDARFYKAGDVAHGSYVYDEADKEKAYFLKDVPPRYFSEIVLQLARATASSQERDEGWKKDAQTL